MFDDLTLQLGVPCAQGTQNFTTIAGKFWCTCRLMVRTEVRYFGWEHHDLWAVLSRNFDSVCSAGIFGICWYDLTCKIVVYVANFHLIFEAIILIFTTKNMMNSINYTLIFNSNPGSGHSHRNNCVSIARFSAVLHSPCSSEHWNSWSRLSEKNSCANGLKVHVLHL
jgi:hypothetical protein